MEKLTYPRLLVLCILAGAAVVPAQEPFAVPACDQLLGNGYDQLSGHEKQARLNMYGGCWKRHADSKVNLAYRDILREVEAYKRSATTVANAQVKAEAMTASDILATEHKVAMQALQQQFDDESRAIQLRMNPENRRELLREQSEVTRRRRAEITALQFAQSRERADLTQRISNAYTRVTQYVDELVQEDKENLAEQQKEKLRYLLRWHDVFVNTPADQSMREYAASKPIGRLEEVEGEVWVTGRDGKRRKGEVGTPVHQGDVIGTSLGAAAYMRFDDETTFAVSEDHELEIDEFVYDPEWQPTSNFSWIKALFVFTSGLIGRDDEPDREIELPVGTIGIRG